MMYEERERGPEDCERRMMKEGREMVETRMRDYTDGEGNHWTVTVEEGEMIVWRRTTSHDEKTIVTGRRQWGVEWQGEEGFRKTAEPERKKCTLFLQQCYGNRKPVLREKEHKEKVHVYRLKCSE